VLCYPRDKLFAPECEWFFNALISLQYVNTIFVLEDSYPVWLENYGFLSFPSSDSCLSEVYPSHIIDNIYLSSDLCAQYLSVLKNLNIKYILSVCSTENVFENHDEYPIKYFEIFSYC